MQVTKLEANDFAVSMISKHVANLSSSSLAYIVLYRTEQPNLN